MIVPAKIRRHSDTKARVGIGFSKQFIPEEVASPDQCLLGERVAESEVDSICLDESMVKC